MTNCYKHPDVSAAAACIDCGQPICAECIQSLNGEAFCPADYAVARHEGGVLMPAMVLSYQSFNQPQVPLTVEIIQYQPSISLPRLRSRVARTQSRTARQWESNAAMGWAIEGLMCGVFQLVFALSHILLPWLFLPLSIAGEIMSFTGVKNRHQTNHPALTSTLGTIGLFLNQALAIIWLVVLFVSLRYGYLY